jgi:hypothetical protein
LESERNRGSTLQNDELTNLSGQLVALGQARDGELYAVGLGVRIFSLVGDGTGPGADDFPILLSETGCFDPADPAQPVTGVLPYEVASPFWSDVAEKDRYMAVPRGEVVTVASDGHFDFPIGTVLAKTFTIGSRRDATFYAA